MKNHKLWTKSLIKLGPVGGKWSNAPEASHVSRCESDIQETFYIQLKIIISAFLIFKTLTKEP
jgi:hypothetical protein